LSPSVEFGGDHVGKYAERCQPRRHSSTDYRAPAQPRQAIRKETRSDATSPTHLAVFTAGTKPRNLREAQLFSSESAPVEISDNQT